MEEHPGHDDEYSNEALRKLGARVRHLRRKNGMTQRELSFDGCSYSYLARIEAGDPSILPRRPNIHFLGQRGYEQLPSYLAGWDVCLLPFARNDATRFISPTKTLEYMAAEKPIVSTPITDVADPYGQIVHLGDTAAEFIVACEAALRSPETERKERIHKMRDVLSKTSWDSTVRGMEQQIAKALTRSGSAPPGLPAPASAIAGRRCDQGCALRRVAFARIHRSRRPGARCRRARLRARRRRRPGRPSQPCGRAV